MKIRMCMTITLVAYFYGADSFKLLATCACDFFCVNLTDSAHPINARSASNMIPCSPANNSTDVHHYDIVSSRSSPSHFTNDTPLNISKVRTRSTTKKLNHCLENQIGYHLRNRNMGKCSCCNSSQDD